MTARPVEELIASLEAGIANLSTSEAWREWLDTQRAFHRYSFGNCLLIARQRPDATQVAGFHAWRQLGRWVRKGETAIRILAPMTRTREVETDGGESEKVTSLLGFRVAFVFDISQTDGRDLPATPCQRLTGDNGEAMWVGLADVAAELRYSILVTNDLPGERNGDCCFETKTIRVRASNAPAQRVKTLAHELAHALLHEDGTTPRAVAELEAESVAYVVCQGLDLDSSAYSIGYVAHWAGGSEEAITGIRASGDRISRASRTILAALDRGAGRGEDAA